jgi:hypothetical protein
LRWQRWEDRHPLFFVLHENDAVSTQHEKAAIILPCP